MSAQPSRALRALERAVAVMPSDQVVTWAQLQDKLAEAALDAELAELAERERR